MSQNTASSESEDIIELTDVVEYAQKKGASSGQQIDFDSQLSDLIGKGKEVNVNNPPELEELLAGIGEEAQEVEPQKIEKQQAPAMPELDDEPDPLPIRKPPADPLDVDSLIDGLDIPPTTQAASPDGEDEGEVADLDSLLDSLFSSPAATQISAAEKAPVMQKTAPEEDASFDDLLSSVAGDLRPQPADPGSLDDLLASVADEITLPQPKAQTKPLSSDELDALFDSSEPARASANPKGAPLDPLDALLDSLPSEITPKLAPDTAVIPTQDELDSLLADLDTVDPEAVPPLPKPARATQAKAPAPDMLELEPDLPLEEEFPIGKKAAGANMAKQDKALTDLFSGPDLLNSQEKPKPNHMDEDPLDAVLAGLEVALPQKAVEPQKKTPHETAAISSTPNMSVPDGAVASDEIARLEGMVRGVESRLDTLEQGMRETANTEVDLLGSLTADAPATAAIQEMIMTRLDAELPGRIAEQLPSLLPEPEEPATIDEPEEDPMIQTVEDLRARLTVLEEWQQSERVAKAESAAENAEILPKLESSQIRLTEELEALRAELAALREALDSLQEETRGKFDKSTAVAGETTLLASELQSRLNELGTKIDAVSTTDEEALSATILSIIRPEIRQVAAGAAAAEETSTAFLNDFQARLAALETRPEAPNAANIVQDVLTLVHADMEQATTETTAKEKALSTELEDLKKHNATLEARLAALEGRPIPQVILPDLPDAEAITLEVLEKVQSTLDKSAAEAAARILREEIMALFASAK